MGKRFSIALSIGAACLFLSSPALPFSGRDGAEFLSIPVGGRPAALGGAYSALATDAYAPVVNPSGMAFASGHQLAVMHLDNMSSIPYEFASFTSPVGRGQSVGAAIQFMRPSDQTRTDVNGNPDGTFSGSFGAYSLAYALALRPTVSLGAAAKYVRASIAGYDANAYAVDLGGTVEPSPHTRLAAVLSNIGSRLKFIDNADALPTTFRLGGAVTPTPHWTGALQGSYSRAGTNGEAGVEWSPVPLLAIRAGYRTEVVRELDSAAGFTAGVGFRINGQRFDYAWAPLGDLGNQQYFSAVFQWGAAPEGPVRE